MSHIYMLLEANVTVLNTAHTRYTYLDLGALLDFICVDGSSGISSHSKYRFSLNRYFIYETQVKKCILKKFIISLEMYS